jgi:uncharacterized protein (UPF0335 family)
MSDNRLKSLADRIEKLMDDRDDIQGDIRDIYAEAKSAGYVPKVLRKAITRKRMDKGKRDEEDAILGLYEDALSPKMRRAVEMAKGGASARQIETETGIDHVTVTRSVSLNKKAETHNPETGEITDPAEAGSVGVEAGRPSKPSPPAEQSVHPVPPPERTALSLGNGEEGRPGAYSDDDITVARTECVDGNECLDVRCDLEGCRLKSSTQFEAPTTPSVGAVASESERVAPDDDLTIPPHLRGPSPVNRRARV